MIRLPCGLFSSITSISSTVVQTFPQLLFSIPLYIFLILSWSFPVCPHLLKSVVTESSHNILIRSSWMHNITERLLPNVPWIIPFNKFQNHNGLGSASRLQVFLLYFCLVGSFITNKCYLTLETNICVNVTLILLLTFQKNGKISKC